MIGSCKSTRLVNKELSGLWKVRTPKGNSIPGPFRPEELAGTLRRLKLGKSLGLDSIFRGVCTPRRVSSQTLILRFPRFLFAPSSIKGINSCDPKPLGDPKSYRPISLLCVTFKILERLICNLVETLVDFSTREVDC